MTQVGRSAFKVFDALATSFVWCVTKGAGLLNHVTIRGFAGRGC